MQNEHLIAHMLHVHLTLSVENTFQQMMFFWRIWGLAMKDMVQLFPKFEGNGLENEV